LINAMHAFVSSRYVVIEHVSLGSSGLLPAFWHEGLGCETVKFGEPRRDVRKYWFNQHASSGATNSDAVPVKPELARQAHGLTSAVLEELGSGGHVVS
jgi:hypothetical protein